MTTMYKRLTLKDVELWRDAIAPDREREREAWNVKQFGLLSVFAGVVVTRQGWRLLFDVAQNNAHALNIELGQRVLLAMDQENRA